MTEITRENFTAAMRAAVEERGSDWVYPGGSNQVAVDEGWRDGVGNCQYSLPDGTPACLIGLALHKIDPELSPPHGETYAARKILYGIGCRDEGLMAAAEEAQVIQDRGRSWGKALAEYERFLGIGEA